MLARTHRFHGNNSVRGVYIRGKLVRSSLLSLRYLENPKRSDYRVAVVVSKKVEKSAVKRNRIRRRIYEIISSLDEKINDSYDMVITVFSSDISDSQPAELAKGINDLLKRANII